MPHKPKRRKYPRPKLAIPQILAWADAFHQRTGTWPRNAEPSPVPGAPAETWASINQALGVGNRGLPGGSSLAQLLANHRGVRHHKGLRPLTVELILAWADAFHQRTGTWPRNAEPSPVPGAPREKWANLNTALYVGKRGLPGGSSLARLLAEHRGVPHHKGSRRLTVELILAWMDAFHQRTGTWPKSTAQNPIPGAPGEKWVNLNAALHVGKRGLPGGSSLARLLAEHRGVGKRRQLPPLPEDTILCWLEQHYRRNGTWPVVRSGPIADAPEQTWSGVDQALREGLRGLPGGDTLAQLRARRLGEQWSG
ncbi:MAG TPA: hypothetical protein VG013_15685 [Gemmataceae bacterium]|jgi:hypothetical protein|nr:hypothetical protein [Gemmataceae bacterium]